MSEDSTTPDLVELVRLVIEAINRRDFDAVESFYAGDAVYVGTEIGTLAGAAAIRREIEDMMRSYDDFHAANEEVLDLGNGVTFCVRVFTAHPVGSSGEVRIRFGSVASWTEGLIERENTYVDIAEARAAAERLAEARG